MQRHTAAHSTTTPRASTAPATPSQYRVIYPSDAADADAALRRAVAHRGVENDQEMDVVARSDTPRTVRAPAQPPLQAPSPPTQASTEDPSGNPRPRRPSRMSLVENGAAPLMTHAQAVAAATAQAASAQAAARAALAAQSAPDRAVVERNRPENAARRRLHDEFQRRPRVVLEVPPLLTTVSVLDREHWSGGLCRCPGYFLCGCKPASMPPALAVATLASSACPSARPDLANAGPSEKVRQQQNLLAILNMTPENMDMEDLLAMGAHRGGTSGATAHHRQVPANAPPHTGIYVTETPGVYPNPLLPSTTTTHFSYHNEDGDMGVSSPTNDLSISRMSGGLLDVRGDTSPRHRRGEDKDVSSQRCDYLANRLFCTRCTIAQQTALLFEEERQRRRYPTRFCLECLLGKEGHYSHSLALMIVLDILTLGWCPLGCFYMGCGTALYTWRLRYLVRLRYRLMGYAWRDCLISACCATCAVDQLTSEMAVHGLPETTDLADVARIVKMR